MQNPISIMIVDTEPDTAERVRHAIAAYLSKITTYSSVSLMVEALAETSVDVIILNLERPFEETFDLLPSLKARRPAVEIVFITRFDDETLWVEAIQRGAYDLLPRPIDVSELARILLHAVEKHRGKLRVMKRRPPSQSVQLSGAGPITPKSGKKLPSLNESTRGTIEVSATSNFGLA
jgi:DNA-binding NtrC family response regulator